jgi:hypothetical protein
MLRGTEERLDGNYKGSVGRIQANYTTGSHPCRPALSMLLQWLPHHSTSAVTQDSCRGGQLGKCPNMCLFCTQKPAIHSPFVRLEPFLL